MAERLLKKKPCKVATVGRDDPIAPPVGSRVPRDRHAAAVLVGTY